MMISLVFGGSSSGKSEYAERLVIALSGDENRYYIATMDSRGAEAKRRIARHLMLRRGKGFTTVECPVNILSAADHIPDKDRASLLIESLSTLLANEMFGEGRYPDGDVSGLAGKIYEELTELCRNVSNAVIVSDNIFEDGMEYDASSVQYAAALGMINSWTARSADQVTEVIAGIPVQLDTDRGPEDMHMDNNGSSLVIGGFAQGKLSWVTKSLAERKIRPVIFDETTFDGQEPDLSGIKKADALIIDHFHLIVKQKGARKALELMESLKAFCIREGASLTVISDEVGNGVVPADVAAIRYREEVGDALQALAGSADHVYRIACGIPVTIK